MSQVCNIEHIRKKSTQNLWKTSWEPGTFQEPLKNLLRFFEVFLLCLVLRFPWRVVLGFELAKTGFELSKTGSELSKTGSFFFAWFLVLVLVPGCRVNNFFVRLRWFLYCKRWFLNWVLECGARTSHTKMVFAFLSRDEFSEFLPRTRNSLFLIAKTLDSESHD